jgi:glycerol-1-phosphatase
VAIREPELRSWLRATDRALSHCYDVVLLDLDGTVYIGRNAVPQAPRTVEALVGAGVRPVFVTNNASRPPESVAEQLRTLGIACSEDQVVTAAQAGAAVLVGRIGRGGRVLVVGGPGVRAALVEAGLEPVERADERPDAVLQGWSPDLGWSGLAEGAYALAAGLPWVVTNADPTLPTERGIAPGNGAFVQLLARTTGRTPDEIAGKPRIPLLRLALDRWPGERPLVVGDRLDTDIEAAVAADLPSLLVLSGVTHPQQLLDAVPAARPTYVAADVSGLLVSHPDVSATDAGWRCGRWIASVDMVGGVLALHAADASSDRDDAARGHADRASDGLADSDGLAGRAAEGLADSDGDGLDWLRAACAAAWSAADAGVTARPDDALRVLLERPVPRGGENGSAGQRP